MLRVSAVLIGILAPGVVLAADVFRCADAQGNVLYANSPCETHGAKTTKKFRQDELEPMFVRLPKAAQPDPASATSIIEKLQGPSSAIDPAARQREGNPALQPKGPRNLALDRMEQGADHTGASLARSKAKVREALARY